LIGYFYNFEIYRFCKGLGISNFGLRRVFYAKPIRILRVIFIVLPELPTQSDLSAVVFERLIAACPISNISKYQLKFNIL
ncbi:TPA: hypothetical protein ACKN3O_001754, partial [Neisseria gonorrhoeae]